VASVGFCDIGQFGELDACPTALSHFVPCHHIVPQLLETVSGASVGEIIDGNIASAIHVGFVSRWIRCWKTNDVIHNFCERHSSLYITAKS
jgi:hypothetical protein